jgi:hypothetical protein
MKIANSFSVELAPVLPLTQELTIVPDDSHPLTVTTLDPVEMSITAVIATTEMVQVTVVADAKPWVTSTSLTTQPVISGPIGRATYQIACPRPAAGATATLWEVDWEYDTRNVGLLATVPATGPVILWPKPEGPK